MTLTAAYFIRHGQSQANAGSIIAGSQESPLTVLGREQANEAISTIQRAGVGFDRVVSSPMSRAHETAQIIAQGIGFDPSRIELIEQLSERNGGVFEGGSAQALFESGPSDEPVVATGGESYEQFTERIVRANGRINIQSGETVLVIGHSGSYRAALCYSLCFPASELIYISSPRNADLLRYPL